MPSSLSSFTCLVLCLVATTTFADEGALGGRGFGDDYTWHNLEDGMAAAKELNKPAMIVIHKSWCGACKRLGPQFAKSEDIKAKSEKFVMINVLDDEEPKGKEYTPDGGYIPRILFVEPTGKVRPDIVNAAGNPKYKYFYSTPDQIVKAMDMAEEELLAGAGSTETEL